MFVTGSIGYLFLLVKFSVFNKNKKEQLKSTQIPFFLYIDSNFHYLSYFFTCGILILVTQFPRPQCTLAMALLATVPCT